MNMYIYITKYFCKHAHLTILTKSEKNVLFVAFHVWIIIREHYDRCHLWPHTLTLYSLYFKIISCWVQWNRWSEIDSMIFIWLEIRVISQCLCPCSISQYSHQEHVSSYRQYWKNSRSSINTTKLINIIDSSNEFFVYIMLMLIGL